MSQRQNIDKQSSLQQNVSQNNVDSKLILIALQKNLVYQNFLHQQLHKIEQLSEVNDEKRRIMQRTIVHAGSSSANPVLRRSLLHNQAIPQRVIFAAPWFVDDYGTFPPQTNDSLHYINTIMNTTIFPRYVAYVKRALVTPFHFFTNSFVSRPCPLSWFQRDQVIQSMVSLTKIPLTLYSATPFQMVPKTEHIATFLTFNQHVSVWKAIVLASYLFHVEQIQCLQQKLIDHGEYSVRVRKHVATLFARLPDDGDENDNNDLDYDEENDTHKEKIINDNNNNDDEDDEDSENDILPDYFTLQIEDILYHYANQSQQNENNENNEKNPKTQNGTFNLPSAVQLHEFFSGVPFASSLLLTQIPLPVSRLPPLYNPILAGVNEMLSSEPSQIPLPSNDEQQKKAPTRKQEFKILESVTAATAIKVQSAVTSEDDPITLFREKICSKPFFNPLNYNDLWYVISLLRYMNVLDQNLQFIESPFLNTIRQQIKQQQKQDHEQEEGEEGRENTSSSNDETDELSLAQLITNLPISWISAQFQQKTFSRFFQFYHLEQFQIQYQHYQNQYQYQCQQWAQHHHRALHANKPPSQSSIAASAASLPPPPFKPPTPLPSPPLSLLLSLRTLQQLNPSTMHLYTHNIPSVLYPLVNIYRVAKYLWRLVYANIYNIPLSKVSTPTATPTATTTTTTTTTTTSGVPEVLFQRLQYPFPRIPISLLNYNYIAQHYIGSGQTGLQCFLHIQNNRRGYIHVLFFIQIITYWFLYHQRFAYIRLWHTLITIRQNLVSLLSSTSLSSSSLTSAPSLASLIPPVSEQSELAPENSQPPEHIELSNENTNAANLNNNNNNNNIANISKLDYKQHNFSELLLTYESLPQITPNILYFPRYDQKPIPTTPQDTFLATDLELYTLLFQTHKECPNPHSSALHTNHIQPISYHNDYQSFLSRRFTSLPNTASNGDQSSTFDIHYPLQPKTKCEKYWASALSHAHLNYALSCSHIPTYNVRSNYISTRHFLGLTPAIFQEEKDEDDDEEEEGQNETQKPLFSNGLPYSSHYIYPPHTDYTTLPPLQRLDEVISDEELIHIILGQSPLQQEWLQLQLLSSNISTCLPSFDMRIAISFPVIFALYSRVVEIFNNNLSEAQQSYIMKSLWSCELLSLWMTKSRKVAQKQRREQTTQKITQILKQHPKLSNVYGFISENDIVYQPPVSADSHNVAQKSEADPESSIDAERKTKPLKKDPKTKTASNSTKKGKTSKKNDKDDNNIENNVDTSIDDDDDDQDDYELESDDDSSNKITNDSDNDYNDSDEDDSENDNDDDDEDDSKNGLLIPKSLYDDDKNCSEEDKLDGMVLSKHQALARLLHKPSLFLLQRFYMINIYPTLCKYAKIVPVIDAGDINIGISQLQRLISSLYLLDISNQFVDNNFQLDRSYFGSKILPKIPLHGDIYTFMYTNNINRSNEHYIHYLQQLKQNYYQLSTNVLPTMDPATFDSSSLTTATTTTTTASAIPPTVQQATHVPCIPCPNPLITATSPTVLHNIVTSISPNIQFLPSSLVQQCGQLNIDFSHADPISSLTRSKILDRGNHLGQRTAPLFQIYFSWYRSVAEHHPLPKHLFYNIVSSSTSGFGAGSSAHYETLIKSTALSTSIIPNNYESLHYRSPWIFDKRPKIIYYSNPEVCLPTPLISTSNIPLATRRSTYTPQEFIFGILGTTPGIISSPLFSFFQHIGQNCLRFQHYLLAAFVYAFGQTDFNSISQHFPSLSPQSPAVLQHDYQELLDPAVSHHRWVLEEDLRLLLAVKAHTRQSIEPNPLGIKTLHEQQQQQQSSSTNNTQYNTKTDDSNNNNNTTTVQENLEQFISHNIDIVISWDDVSSHLPHRSAKQCKFRYLRILSLMKKSPNGKTNLDSWRKKWTQPRQQVKNTNDVNIDGDDDIQEENPPEHLEEQPKGRSTKVQPKSTKKIQTKSDGQTKRAEQAKDQHEPIDQQQNQPQGRRSRRNKL